MGITAAYGGERLSQLLSGPILLVLFAVLMIVTAALMLRKGAGEPPHAGTAPLVW